MKSKITKYLSGKSSADEQAELLKWIRNDDHLAEFQQIKEEWNTEIVKDPVPFEFTCNWQSIQNQMMEQLQSEIQGKQRSLNFFRYAAVLLVAISFPALIYIFTSGRNTIPLTYTTVAADYGQISKVVLPDSSLVWINSGSSIKYNNHFSASNRNIELVGEAFFKVKHNANVPLIVSNSGLSVKVLGTEFSVSAYPEEANIQVVLEKGKVELTSSTNPNFSKEMKPGELASFDKTQSKLLVGKVNTNLYTSWKDGTINIYNLPLSELVIKLEKRYNQKFEVDEAIKNMPYTFTIKNEDLSNVLRLMEKITPIVAIQDKNTIKLTHNKTKLK
jgi:ferric-dicitrate binding protein FerR (iron transport regulator)